MQSSCGASRRRAQRLPAGPCWPARVFCLTLSSATRCIRPAGSPASSLLFFASNGFMASGSSALGVCRRRPPASAVGSPKTRFHVTTNDWQAVTQRRSRDGGGGQGESREGKGGRAGASQDPCLSGPPHPQAAYQGGHPPRSAQRHARPIGFGHPHPHPSTQRGSLGPPPGLAERARLCGVMVFATHRERRGGG